MKFAVFALAIVSASAAWDKFFLIMFENHGYDQVLANAGWKAIMNGSFQLTNYHAVTHPSQPNYVAQIAGTFAGCTTDSPCNLAETHLINLAEAKSVSWKGYMEEYVPGTNGACNLVTSANGYYRKHNPFMSFTDITGNLTRCQKIVNETQFQADVKANALPQFGYYTPNIDNDSHDQDLNFSSSYFSKWLAAWYTPYVSTTWAKTLFMVTFDEDEGSEGNHVVAFFKHPSLSASSDDTSFTHYSITKFVENNWNLGTLNQNDVKAADFAPVLH